MKGEARKGTQIEVVILLATIATVLSLTQLRYTKVEGNPIPTILFNGSDPSLFHAFVLSLNFAFFGSFNSLTLRHGYPKLANCFLLLSLLSTATGAVILIYLSLPIFFSFARHLIASQ